MDNMASNRKWPGWLEKLWWREAWLTLEAAEPAILPPYLGSILRGALGDLLRTVLCEAPGGEGAGPFLLLAPPPPGLEEIAMGGAASLPYRTGPPRDGETIPTLRCEAGWNFDFGGTLDLGLRLVGRASNALPAILEAVARCGLAVGGAQFRLVAARDSRGRLLYDRRWPGVAAQMPAAQRLSVEKETAGRIRIVFLSPTELKLASAPTFAPEDFAARFFEYSIERAGQMYRACLGARPSRVEAPARAAMAGHRLFHYELPHHGFQQDAGMHFDGVAGYIDLAGELGPAMPWARAAEVLHFGEKAALGLGKVRVLVLE
jgi:hypothetical protein